MAADKERRERLNPFSDGFGEDFGGISFGLDGLYSDVSLSKRRGIRTVYISPLKALGYDVERNLREPMRGIGAAAQAMGVEVPGGPG